MDSPKRHGSSSCTTCNKKFASLMALRRHMEIHTRRFKCTSCEQEFSGNAELVKHSRTHSNEKQFECGQCHK